ncbi:zinc-dependent metalloprotease family protein [Psychromonas arctica]|uniref:zinc-dependent metalloprotease family protein n=1 Tax=Psychromonas arctica TaxID=168275 RepID=UPI00041337C7|nr:zinc-dependent metalloprotease family protein [Psychromonas arctica]
MKKTLLSSAICLSFAVAPSIATAVNLEVAFQYPASFEETQGNEMSRYVVGFYRQLETANAIYANNGVDITLVPAYIQPLTFTYTNEFDISGDYDDSSSNTEAVTILREHYDQETEFMPQVDIHVGLTKSTLTLGNAGSYSQADYDNGGNTIPEFRMSLGLSDVNLLSPENLDIHDGLLAHEVGHTIGLEHYESQVVGDWTDVNDEIGYSTLCDNNVHSLIYQYAIDAPYQEVQISGATGCVGDNGADSVTFLNKYAPLMANFVDDSNVNTLSLDVVENVTDELFTFTVTRTKNIATADTGKLYIAGGSNDDEQNETVAPISLVFEAGSATSSPVTVDFSVIHPMFDIANDSKASTYAVAVLNDEVMPQNIDLLTLNTAWVAPVDETTDTGSNTGTASSGGSGGGGSSSFAFLMLMFTALVLRKKVA